MKKIALFGTFFTKAKDEKKFDAYFNAQDYFSSEVVQALNDLLYSSSPFSAHPGTLKGVTRLELTYVSTEGNTLKFSIAQVENRDVYFVYNLRDTADNQNSSFELFGSFSDTIYGSKSFYVRDGYLYISDQVASINGNSLIISDVEVTDDITKPFYLYTDQCILKTNVLFSKYGSYLGLPRRDDSFMYLTHIKAMWKAMVNRRNLEDLESATAAILGLPLAWEDGKVIATGFEGGAFYYIVEHPTYGQVKYLDSTNSQTKYSIGDNIKEFATFTDLIEIYYFNPKTSQDRTEYYLHASKTLRTLPFEASILHADGYSWIPLRRDAIPGNIVEIYSAKDPDRWKQAEILSIERRKFDSLGISIPITVAKINPQSAVFEQKEKVIVYLRPSAQQLYDYANKMIILVRIKGIEVPVSITQLMEKFFAKYEMLSQLIVLIAANIIVPEEDGTPTNPYLEIQVADSHAADVYWDLTERVNNYRFNQLDVDNTTVSDVSINYSQI